MKTKIVEYHILKKIDDKKYFIRHLKTLREAEKVAKAGIKEHGFESVQITRFRLHKSDFRFIQGIPICSWKHDGFSKKIFKKI